MVSLAGQSGSLARKLARCALPGTPTGCKPQHVNLGSSVAHWARDSHGHCGPLMEGHAGWSLFCELALGSTFVSLFGLEVCLSVTADQEKKLSLAETFTRAGGGEGEGEECVNLGSELVLAVGARVGQEGTGCPAGCQGPNGMAESRVTAVPLLLHPNSPPRFAISWCHQPQETLAPELWGPPGTIHETHHLPPLYCSSCTRSTRCPCWKPTLGASLSFMLCIQSIMTSCLFKL